MWIFRLTNLLLIFAAALLIVTWTYFEAAVNYSMSEQKTFSYFYVVWGGTAVLAAIRCISVSRTIWGRLSFSLKMNIAPFTLGLIFFSCGFTLHAVAAATPEFDLDHLKMPFFMPMLFLPLHFALSAWLLFTKPQSLADRGLYLLLIFHTLNGAVFNTEFYMIIGLAIITLIRMLIENRGQWRLPPLFIGIPLLLLLVAVGVSAFWAINPIHSAAALSHIGVCAVVFVSVLSRERPESFLLKLFGILIFTTGLVLTSTLLLMATVSSVLGPMPVISTRLSIFYQHPNFLAPYFSAMSLIAIVMALLHRRLLIRLSCLLVGFLSIAALWTTDSRAGFLGFGAGFCVFLGLLFPWKKLLPSFVFNHKIKIVAAGLLAFMAVVAVVAVFSDDILDAARKSTRLRRAQDYRLDAWANSAEIIQKNPWTGIGLNTFMSVKKYPPGSKFSHEETAPHPHNLPLYVAQSCGLPALFFFLLLLGGFAWGIVVILARTESRRTKYMIIACAAASIALLCAGLMDLGLSLKTLFPGVIWLFMAIVGSLWLSRHPDRQRHVALNNLFGIVVLGFLVYGMICTFVLPVSGRILLKRCALSLADDDYAETARLGKMSLVADPYLEQSQSILLQYYLREERTEEAIHLLEDAVRLQPENTKLFMKLGDVLSDAEQHERAAAQYRKAVEKDHGSSNLSLYYSKLIYEETKLNRRQAASEALQAAIKQDIAVINMISWEVRPHEKGRDDQYLSFSDGLEILRLEEVLDTIFHGRKQSAEQGVKQDRFDWFSLYHAYNNAFIYDGALAVLDQVEAIFGEKEKAVTDCLRAEVAEKQGDLEKSRALISQAEARGDVTNPAASLYYQSRKSEISFDTEKAGLDEEIATQRRTLAGLRDYTTSHKSFRTVLDNLLAALEAKGDIQGQIEPLKARIFFCVDKRQQVLLLLRLASLFVAADQRDEAEETVSRALDLLADQSKRMSELDDLERRIGMRQGAELLTRAYDKAGLSRIERMKRVTEITELYSLNPARLLFKFHFLIQNNMPEEADLVLDMALIDNTNRLFLWEHKALVSHLIDDMEGMHDAYREIRNIYLGWDVDLENRCNTLFGAIVQNRENVELILELALNKSYIYKLDQSINILNEAMKLMPDEPALHMLAARVYRMNDKPRRALEALDKALQLDPDNSLTRTAREHLSKHLVADGSDKEAKGGAP